MEKKVFENPEATVVLFDKADILTLSNGGEGVIPEIKW